MLQLEETFVLQLPVRAHYSVGVHDQILGNLADGWELISFTERACLHRVLDLLHELHIERDARGLV